MGILVAGFVARAALVSIAPRYAFVGDHVDYVCWGRQAVAAGILDLYRHPPKSCPTEMLIDGQWRHLPSGTGERLNYPPLAAYIFALEGRLLDRLAPDPVANTVTSRSVYALSTTLAELTTALGVAAAVGAFASPWAVAAAFGATWLAPPLLLDGPFWGQTESWILAPGMWMVLAMARRRWLLAGALWGVALALKPSGLIFTPLWFYVFLFRPERSRIVLAGVLALAAMNVPAIPFWLDSGLAWLRVTYLENFVYKLQWTTAMSFNVWYADLLTTGVLDPRVPILGITRDAWGTLFLVTGLATAYGLARRWEHRNPSRADFGVLPLAALVMLAAVLLPTRVHSTYGAFTAPFVIATAFLIPRATLGAAACIVTMSLQILSWQWGSLLAMHVQPDESIFPPTVRAHRLELRAIDRPREWTLIIANIAAAAAVAAGIAATARESGARPRA
jgi:Gpi18-like mannosyltransferase